MNHKIKKKEYFSLIKQLKSNIQVSRYNALKSVNKIALLLYFNTGGMLSEKIKSEKWGSKVIKQLSDDIQSEFPGIRGFSFRSFMKMVQFYEVYETNNECQILIGKKFLLQSINLKDFESKKSIGSFATSQFKNIDNSLIDKKKEFMPLPTAQLASNSFLELFLSIGFTQHILLIQKCTDIKQRLFYMSKSVQHQWTVALLEYHINADLYNQKGKLEHNFNTTLPVEIKDHAIQAFKDEYLLDYLNVHEDDTERVFEDEIVKNIKQFMMSLGNEFSFMGNQYKVVVDEDEFFVDLLFFNRMLQAMVAIELKIGKFKPEFAGKMNFYLRALDKLVKLPHENPSIGIILCREKSKTIVEFAFHDVNKPMGVATYKLADKLPKEFEKHLPKAEDLKLLLDQ
jgi:predicted nuclease of restriction endonuclease-like (RecB) superfamily